MNEIEVRGEAPMQNGQPKEVAEVTTGGPVLEEEGSSSWFSGRPGGDRPVDSRYAEPVARGQSEAERRFPCY